MLRKLHVTCFIHSFKITRTSHIIDTRHTHIRVHIFHIVCEYELHTLYVYLCVCTFKNCVLHMFTYEIKMT